MIEFGEQLELFKEKDSEHPLTEEALKRIIELEAKRIELACWELLKNSPNIEYKSPFIEK